MNYSIAFYLSLTLFLCVGLYAGRKGVKDTDTFLTARSTQSWFSLGLNFFSAGVGVWTFFALPQVGSEMGIMGVFAYSFSTIVPILSLAYFGPIIRHRVPKGVTINEFIYLRFGKAAQFLSTTITLVYMTIFLISELTALGDLLKVYPIAILPAQISVCFVTTLYTMICGMQASLLTDTVQGISVVCLIGIIVVGFITHVKLDPVNVSNSTLLKPDLIAIQSIYTLTAANLAANMFHQGYWQRVYSAKSDKELIFSSLFASLLSFPTFFLIGMVGVISVWADLATHDDPLAFFKIVDTLPSWVNLLVLILATAFISSSVDTLQNGIVATIVNDLFMKKISLHYARIITALVNIPVIFIAYQGYNILSLFLVADLAAALIVCPVLIGMVTGPIHISMTPRDKESCDSDSSVWSSPYDENNIAFPEPVKSKDNTSISNTSPSIKTTHSSQIKPSLINYPTGLDFCIGVLGGLMSVILFGAILKKDLWFGFKLLMLPNQLKEPFESLGAFFFAPFGSCTFMTISFCSRKYLGNK